MFWGITPCLDLLRELKLNGEIPKTVNILLIGGADVRHILKTVSRTYRKSKVDLRFYVMEPVGEVIAKQLLLLNIALQPEHELGSVQKTRIYMELFGNTLVRPITAKYLTNRAKEFVKMITNLEHFKTVMPFVNLELKYKERDYIENVFKFWACNDVFDIGDAWDRRLRKYLGIRYDSRSGAFDWDLHMRLHHVGAQHICSQEYQSFRRDGVAFTWLESEVSKPNRTMVTGVIANGDNFGHYGYLGDMHTGPFIAHGIECEDKELLKKQNHQCKYRSTDITERNLREIFHELEFKEEYVHRKTTDVTLGSCVAQLSDLKVIDTGNIAPTKTKSIKCFDLDDVTINFLSINALNMMQHKDKFKDFFHIIYYGNSFLKYLTKDVVMHIAAAKCLLLIENQKFVTTYREKELEEHSKVIEASTEELEKCACPFDFKTDSYAKFVLKC